MTSKGLRSLAAIGIGLTMAAAAYAGQISDPVISINWSSGDVGGSFTVPYDASLYNAETGWYRWALSEPVDLTSGDVTYATVNQLSTQINVDPQISLNFAVTAGAAPVNFTISSASLTFAAINNGSITASAQMGITDNNGDGGILSVNYAGKGYKANYNGGANPVPAGTNYASLVNQVNVGVFGSNNNAEGNPPGGGFNPFVGSISSMASAFSFGVTAQDSATGTSTYVIVPEPASMLLMGLGALFALRRR